MDRASRYIVVKRKDGSTAALNDALKKLRDESLDVRLLAAKDLSALKIVGRDVVFVCDPFSGPAFEALLARTKRIVGPPCILSCLRDDQPVPECEEHPVYSRCMATVQACITSIVPERRAELAHKIELMGGTVSGALKNVTTHVITGNSAKPSTKYRVALNLHLPLMSAEWVDRCWLRIPEQFSATDPEVIQQYRQPALAGTIVCVTGIAADERDGIRAQVEGSGGQYTLNLTPACTHLIAQPGNAKTPKAEFATRWSIHLVTPLWLAHSIKLGGIADAKDFLLNEAQKAAAADTADELSLRERALDFTKLKNRTFLMGVNVFIQGFSGARNNLLMKICRMGRATRHQTLAAMVTHIVASQTLPPEVQAELRKEKRPVLHSDWLVECCKQQRVMPVEDYSFFEYRRRSTASQQSEGAKPSRRRGGVATLDGKIEPSQLGQKDVDAIGEQVRERQRRNLFADRTFHVCEPPFKADNAAIVRQFIYQHSGTCVTSKQGADYCVFPFASPIGGKPEYASLDPSKCVTELFLERCAEDVVIYDPDHHFFFRPLQFEMPVPGFEAVVPTFSGFDLLENQALLEFCHLAGCKIHAYERIDRARTTHLITLKDNTAKVSRAKAWGIPVVTKDWLLQSVRQRRVLETATFATDKPSQVLATPAVAPLPSGKSSQAAPALPTVVEQRPTVNGPESSPALLHTEDTPNSSSPSLLARAASRTGPLVGMSIFIIPELQQQPGWHDLTAAATDLGAVVRVAWDSTCTHLVHSGRSGESASTLRSAKQAKALVVSPYWLRACRATEARESERLYPTSFNPKLNLTMGSAGGTGSSSQAPSSSQRLQPPRAAKSSTSPPRAADTTTAAGAAAAAGGSAQAAAPSSKRSPVSAPSSSRSSKRPRTAAPKQSGAPRRSPRTASGASTPTLTDADVMKMINMATSLAGRTRRPSTSVPPVSSELSGDAHALTIEMQLATGRSHTESPDYGRDDADMDSSQVAVTYDDPGRDARARILAKLRRQDTGQEAVEASATTSSEASAKPEPYVPAGPIAAEAASSSRSSSRADAASSVRPASAVVRKARGGGKLRFLLSTFAEDKKKRLKKLIIELGGEYIDAAHFVPRCTHVVVGKPNRSEKYLAACAAGKWILTEDFLKASERMGKFVAEENYEWAQFAENLSSSEQTWAAAASRWRARLSSHKAQQCGAFAGWRCVLVLDPSVTASFTRLLVAGGGEIVDPESAELGQVSYVIVHRQFAHLVPPVVRALVENNEAPCVVPDFLAEFLHQERPPRCDHYLVALPSAAAQGRRKAAEPITRARKKRRSDAK